MFGIHASSIKQANDRVVQVGLDKIYYTNARAICNSGVNYAMWNIYNIPWSTMTDTVSNFACDGGYFGYGLRKNSTKDTITVTVVGTYNPSNAVNVSAAQIVKFACPVGTRWRPRATFTYPYKPLYDQLQF